MFSGEGDRVGQSGRSFGARGALSASGKWDPARGCRRFHISAPLSPPRVTKKLESGHRMEKLNLRREPLDRDVGDAQKDCHFVSMGQSRGKPEAAEKFLHLFTFSPKSKVSADGGSFWSKVALFPPGDCLPPDQREAFGLQKERSENVDGKCWGFGAHGRRSEGCGEGIAAFDHRIGERFSAARRAASVTSSRRWLPARRALASSRLIR